MAGIAMIQAADNRPFIHDLAALREQVGQDNSGHLGRTNAEFTAILDRGVGFGIPHIDVAGSAAHPENDDRMRVSRTGARLSGSGLKTKQIGQAQSGGSENAGLQETATADAKLLAKFGTA